MCVCVCVVCGCVCVCVCVYVCVCVCVCVFVCVCEYVWQDSLSGIDLCLYNIKWQGKCKKSKLVGSPGENP